MCNYFSYGNNRKKPDFDHCVLLKITTQRSNSGFFGCFRYEKWRHGGQNQTYAYQESESHRGQIPVFSGVSDRKNDVIFTYAYQEFLNIPEEYSFKTEIPKEKLGKFPIPKKLWISKYRKNSRFRGKKGPFPWFRNPVSPLDLITLFFWFFWLFSRIETFWEPSVSPPSCISIEFFSCSRYRKGVCVDKWQDWLEDQWRLEWNPNEMPNNKKEMKLKTEKSVGKPYEGPTKKGAGNFNFSKPSQIDLRTLTGTFQPIKFIDSNS